MNTTRVPPIAHRASWAQQRTPYDDGPAPQPTSPQERPDRPVVLRLRVQRSSDLDALVAFAEARGIAVVEVVE